MSVMCELCGKKPLSGHNVSHSNRKTKRRFMPNLHVLRVMDAGGNFRKLKVCTPCLKTYNKRLLAAY